METLVVFIYILGFLFGYENYQKKHAIININYDMNGIIEI